VKSSDPVRWRVTAVFGATFVASLLTGLLLSCVALAQPGVPASPQPAPTSAQPAPAPTQQEAVPSPQSLKAWRGTMSQTPEPNGGCFKSTYPSTQWQPAPCTAAPSRPYPPARGPRSQTVGNGNDLVAQVSGPPISSATGSFPGVVGVTSESGASNASNAFSLQLNTNTFTTSVCNGTACRGWEQFVYSNQGVVFIQYWMIGYGASCPSGWNTYGSDCWRNGDNATSVPAQTIANLAQLSLAGTANSGGTDKAILSVGSDLYTAANPANMLNLAQGWQSAEFNLFGDCCLSEANLNSGSTVVVAVDVDNGTANAPVCVATGFTGETNNLTAVLPCCPLGGVSPEVIFAESNAAGARSPCSGGSWHNNDLTAATGAPTPAGDPAGYIFTAQNTQHVDYRGTDGHIHELWWDTSGWHHNDLTNAASAPTASGDPGGYVFAAESTQHVDYRGTDGHIHELWWDASGWHHNDLTNAASAPMASGDPTGYVFDAQGTQHVDYSATDGHIHELWWDASGWHNNDLVAATEAPNPTGSPKAYLFTAQSTQHVDYRGTDGHINELWWDTSGWHHNDLTNAASAPVAGGDPAGYVFAAQGTQHVDYRGADGHIHELWWDASGWHQNDLASAASAPTASGDPAGYVFDAQGTQHVDYSATDGHIHELWWDASGWHNDDLVAATGAPSPASNPLGYVFFVQGTQHVIYRANDSHIHELWWG
jgi:hypothetical protein